MTNYFNKDWSDLKDYLEAKDKERDEIENDTFKLIMELERSKPVPSPIQWDLIVSYVILGVLGLFLVTVVTTLIALR